MTSSITRKMNEKILLVEDEEASRTTLSEMLRSEGYVVEIASDGARAFEQASARPFDLIILDATLPGRNHMEVCRDIREAGLVNPVLLLTARGQTTNTVLGLKFGADDCVTKPFEISELLARIEALLRRRPLRTGEGVHHFGAIRIDIPGRKVTREGKRVFWLFGNSSYCATSWNTQAFLWPATNCYARCGGTKPEHSRVRWICMWPHCATNWKRIPKVPS